MPLPKYVKYSFVGFTLIELMISIAIVAIISTVGIVSYSKIQVLARDSKRKEDLRLIANALQLYYNDNKSYPVNSNWVYSNGTQPWIPGLNTSYMSALPTDPSSNGGTPWSGAMGYAYCGAAGSGCSSCNIPAGQFFALVTVLENQSDPDRLEKKDVKWCDGNSLFGYGWSKYAYVITSQ